MLTGMVFRVIRCSRQTPAGSPCNISQTLAAHLVGSTPRGRGDGRGSGQRAQCASGRLGRGSPVALRVSLSESVPDSDMESQSACSRLGEVRALAQSVIELRWTPFFVLYHAAQSKHFLVCLSRPLLCVDGGNGSATCMRRNHPCGRILSQGSWKQSRISEAITQWRAWAEKAPVGGAKLAHAWTKEAVTWIQEIATDA